jgi:hypothetical protein
LAGFIINALTAGNGRSGIARTRDELIQRLREDGVEFKVSDVYTVLGRGLELGFRWVVVNTQRVVEGSLSEAIEAAVDYSLSHNMATVISHDGRELVTVVPDVVQLELVANGTALSGWAVVHRDGARFGPGEKWGIPECTWPECPKRFPNPRGEVGWVQGRCQRSVPFGNGISQR